ncbi:FmdB family zinc ribbon protein [Zafaria sp. Z1313]|uniref:FmdB family zinc ribbon protein n=1 Tax=unclassified Zafaria TaxID=2828765 RepID=UPI002E77C0DD|nr:FmdB family zinc ribbon protein [Zafaria sp. J156]MEE1620453.1 FmdB family zinc ribbon protein [Zafaria sp. J156]
MPTYAYACKDCTHEFETVQSFSDDSLTVCPECRGSLRKKFNSVGVVFKGSGFYRTDSRGGSSASAPAASTTDSASSASGSPSTGASPSGGSTSSSPAPAAASAAS